MKKTIVLGASTNPERYSSLAVKRLTDHGHEVIPVGIRKGLTHGLEIDITKKIYKDVDTITMYISPKHQKEWYKYIIMIKPARVIFNPGSENPELITLLNENNIEVAIGCNLVMLATDQF